MFINVLKFSNHRVFESPKTTLIKSPLRKHRAVKGSAIMRYWFITKQEAVYPLSVAKTEAVVEVS